MIDDTGEAGFYTVDAQNDDIYPFVVVESDASGDSVLFFVLFIVFLILSIAEAFMLAMFIIQVRKRRPHAPKVRRV